MVDISEFIKSGYLNARTVKEEKIKVLEITEYVGAKTDQWENQRVEIKVVDEKKNEHDFSLNVTNLKTISGLFGVETNAWIGKKINVTVVPTAKGDGVLVLGEAK